MDGGNGTSRSLYNAELVSNYNKESESLLQQSKEDNGLRQLTLRFNEETVFKLEEIAEHEGISLAKAFRMVVNLVVEDIEDPGPVLRDLLDEVYSNVDEDVQDEITEIQLDYFLKSKVNE